MNDRAPSAAADPAGRPGPAVSSAPDGAESPADRLTALLGQAGANAGRVLRVPAALSGGRWWTARELVRHTAVAYRIVDAVLAALGSDLDVEEPPQPRGQSRGAGRAEVRYRLRRGADYAWTAALAAPDPAAGPLADAERRFPEAAEELARLVAGAPAPRADLDHIAATPGTALRRGAYLADHLALGGRRLLCVGDHDLTSLAALLVAPDAEAAVVDVDERMLDYIDAEAGRLGLPVRCFFADLRLGIPAAAGGADLAFTDPPYTPDGVDLFVRRSLQGLADPRQGRVAVAYGASETTPQLVKSTQARLARLDVLVEALLPEFNRYTGAEAIGASSDLYVLRGTAKNAPADPPEQARIYSQGGNAKESAVRRAGMRAGAAANGGNSADADRAGGDSSAADAVSALLEGADVAVGPWNAEQLPPGVRPVGLRAWLAAPVPVERAAVVDLTAGWEGLLSRALLAAGGGAVRALVRSTAQEVRTARGQAALRGLLGPGRTVRFLAGRPGPGWTAVEVSASETAALAPGPRLAAHCVGSAHGPLPRVLREGLIGQARADVAVNKRTARTLIAEHAPWTAGHTLLDLPAHRFPDLHAACAAITAAAGLPE